MYVNYFKTLINIIDMGLLFISIYLCTHKQTYNKCKRVVMVVIVYFNTIYIYIIITQSLTKHNLNVIPRGTVCFFFAFFFWANGKTYNCVYNCMLSFCVFTLKEYSLELFICKKIGWNINRQSYFYLNIYV